MRAAPDRGIARLHALLEQGRAAARAAGRPVLVSLTQAMPELDVLGCMEVVRAAGRYDAAVSAWVQEGLAYWSRPLDGLSLAGIGAAATLTAGGAGRFGAIDQAWSGLLKEAIVEAPAGARATGVGPMLMGGFAFDPDGPRTAIWNGFPSALFIVPRVQLACTPDGCWVTMAVEVSAESDVDGEATAMDALLDAMHGTPTPPRLHSRPATSAPTFDELPTAREWQSLVAAATARIRAGEMEKVVLARGVHAKAVGSFDAIAALRHLRDAFPTTHVFGFWRGERAFIGASPERLVRLEGGVIRSSSLAGSIGRGDSPTEDAARAKALLASAKDRAEHEMVRRVILEALVDVCDGIVAAETPEILTLPHVHHLHTPVTGQLRPGHSLLRVVERLHPTPAVGGAPRDMALRFLAAHEPLDRGWYAAPVGWIGHERGEFAVALRSGVVAEREAWCFAGCGIVADSDPACEYEESALKLRPMQLALAAAVAA